MDNIIDIFIAEATKAGDWKRVILYKWLYNSSLSQLDILQQLNNIHYNETNTSNTTKTN